MIKEINVPIYNCTVYLLASPTKKEISKWVNSVKELNFLDKDDVRDLYKWLSDPEKGALGQTMSADGIYYIACVRYKNDYDTMAHEIFHVADKILSERGVEKGEQGEAYAYLIGYITGKVYGQNEKE